MKSCAPTARADASICSCVASARPNARLSRSVPLNRKASWGTIPISARSERERPARVAAAAAARAQALRPAAAPPLRARRAHAHVAQVVAVDEDPPLGGVVEARREL